MQAKASWVVFGQKPAKPACAVSHVLPEQFLPSLAPAHIEEFQNG